MPPQFHSSTQKQICYWPTSMLLISIHVDNWGFTGLDFKWEIMCWVTTLKVDPITCFHANFDVWIHWHCREGCALTQEIPKTTSALLWHVREWLAKVCVCGGGCAHLFVLRGKYTGALAAELNGSIKSISYIIFRILRRPPENTSESNLVLASCAQGAFSWEGSQEYLSICQFQTIMYL